MKKGQSVFEFLLTYGWAIVIIIVVVGALFVLQSQVDYESETKAFRTDEYACDLYIEYENDMLVNITLVDCIKRLN